MKLIYKILTLLLLCGIATASMEDLQPYTISVIVWDADGSRDENVAVTFAYTGQSDTLYTADDGSVSFSLLNFDDVPDGAYINVSSKYEAKDVSVDYEYGATGVTFNEPSQDAAIAAFAALGFIAVAAGGGIYFLTRKKKGGDE
jgi:hypothetical protein